MQDGTGPPGSDRAEQSAPQFLRLAVGAGEGIVVACRPPVSWPAACARSACTCIRCTVKPVQSKSHPLSPSARPNKNPEHYSGYLSRDARYETPRYLYWVFVRVFGGLTRCFTRWKRSYHGRRVLLGQTTPIPKHASEGVFYEIRSLQLHYCGTPISYRHITESSPPFSPMHCHC